MRSVRAERKKGCQRAAQLQEGESATGGGWNAYRKGAWGGKDGGDAAREEVERNHMKALGAGIILRGRWWGIRTRREGGVTGERTIELTSRRELRVRRGAVVEHRMHILSRVLLRAELLGGRRTSRASP